MSAFNWPPFTTAVPSGASSPKSSRSCCTPAPSPPACEAMHSPTCRAATAACAACCRRDSRSASARSRVSPTACCRFSRCPRMRWSPPIAASSYEPRRQSQAPIAACTCASNSSVCSASARRTAMGGPPSRGFSSHRLGRKTPPPEASARETASRRTANQQFAAGVHQSSLCVVSRTRTPLWVSLPESFARMWLCASPSCTPEPSSSKISSSVAGRQKASLSPTSFVGRPPSSRQRRRGPWRSGSMGSIVRHQREQWRGRGT
mmetsp:Transcript_9345/g.26292  ORF Transcript_9345/g.26292 Transcript_9345/m.26292 type:complete len:262 (-) Transcript_9345:8-793(-)